VRGTVGMYRVEVSVSAGNGKLRTAGGVSGVTKESINRAFSYMLAKKGDLSIGVSWTCQTSMSR
jgi:ATP-dependent Lon protease